MKLPRVATFNGESGKLQAGTQYWLVAKAATDISMASWCLSGLGIFAQFAGTSWVSHSGRDMPGFQVNDAQSPTITGIANSAGFRPPGYVVSNSWAAIQGSNLAPATDTWDNSIVNGRLPTTLHGVSVSVRSASADLYYISPNQINFLVGDVTTSGPALVTLRHSQGTTAVIMEVSSSGPAFFSWPGNQVVATRRDFSFVAKDGTFAGVAAVPAKPGEVIILWGTGFGPTTPPAPPGVQVPSDTTYSTSMPPKVTMNNIPVTVFGAALAPGYAGLYQVAIQVPDSLADGDWPVWPTVGSSQSQYGSSLVLSVRR